MGYILALVFIINLCLVAWRITDDAHREQAREAIQEEEDRRMTADGYVKTCERRDQKGHCKQYGWSRP